MKNTTRLFAALLIMLTGLISCTEDPIEDEKTALKPIEISTSTTSDAITLEWSPVEGCSWYTIYIAKSGNALEEVATYQDMLNDPITYTISELEAGTSYDIKMEGTDYAIGGEILASETLSVSTEP